MNIYEVLTEDVWTIGGYDPPEPPEPDDYWNLIAAESRGKAKAIAWRDSTDNGKRACMVSFEFTDLRARLLVRGVNVPPGVLPQGSDYRHEYEMLSLEKALGAVGESHA